MADDGLWRWWVSECVEVKQVDDGHSCGARPVLGEWRRWVVQCVLRSMCGKGRSGAVGGRGRGCTARSKQKARGCGGARGMGRLALFPPMMWASNGLATALRFSRFSCCCCCWWLADRWSPSSHTTRAHTAMRSIHKGLTAATIMFPYQHRPGHAHPSSADERHHPFSFSSLIAARVSESPPRPCRRRRRLHARTPNMSNIYHLEPPTKGKVVLHTTFGPIDVELWAREVSIPGLGVVGDRRADGLDPPLCVCVCGVGASTHPPFGPLRVVCAPC